MLAQFLAESLSLVAKATKGAKFQRVAIAGTGRIIYAAKADLPQLYHEHLPRKYDHAAAIDKSGPLPLPRTGKDAAVQKMQEWGEEWAEEEDLPDEAPSSSDTLSSARGGPGVSPSTILSKQLQKEMHIAQSRLQKVLSSKKKF